jgi:hypothetical protein
MSTADLIVPDPQRLRDLLDSVDKRTRAQGERLWSQSGVFQLVCLEPGVTFTAKVREGRPFTVELSFDDVTGCSGFCDCHEEVDCPHVYAVARRLLDYQGGNLTPPASAPAAPLGQAAVQTLPMAERIMAALGRKLSSSEAKVLREPGPSFCASTMPAATRWRGNACPRACGRSCFGAPRPRWRAICPTGSRKTFTATWRGCNGRSIRPS